MKPQDIVFLVVLLGLFFLKKPKLFEIVGLFCLVLAMPFFAKWIFFTGQRLVMYGGAFILIGALWELVRLRNKKSSRR